MLTDVYIVIITLRESKKMQVKPTNQQKNTRGKKCTLFLISPLRDNQVNILKYFSSRHFLNMQCIYKYQNGIIL